MADLCGTCFRPAKWLVLSSALPKWPLERLACGYHTKGLQRRPLTPKSLAEKLALDDRYGREFSANYVPKMGNTK